MSKYNNGDLVEVLRDALCWMKEAGWDKDEGCFDPGLDKLIKDMHRAVRLAQQREAELPECAYCGGGCPNEPDDSAYLCDGFAGDIDGLYAGELNDEKIK